MPGIKVVAHQPTLTVIHLRPRPAARTADANDIIVVVVGHCLGGITVTVSESGNTSIGVATESVTILIDVGDVRGRQFAAAVFGFFPFRIILMNRRVHPNLICGPVAFVLSVHSRPHFPDL